MHEGKFVFSQIISFIPWYEFDKCVKRYKGNYRIRNFSCKDHFLSMIFAQLSYKNSLRDIELSLLSQKDCLYHMGFRCKSIPKTTLSKANEIRDYKIYKDFALVLIDKVKKLYKDESVIEDKNFNFEKSIYALDSSIIKVSLILMPWARYMSNPKNELYNNIGAVKLHTLFDLRSNIPSVNVITNGRVYDGEILDNLIYEIGSMYIMDRGYLDYDRLYNIELNKAFFITRTHPTSTKVKRIYSNKINKKNNKHYIFNKDNNIKGKIVYDQLVRFTTKKALKDYPDKLRMIKYKNLDKKRDGNEQYLTFLTNNFTLDAIYIAKLYKKRWEIELFFKWIKQHLRIKRFYSYSMNGVKTQIWIATCTYLLIAIIKKTLNLRQSLNTILQILDFNIISKTPINRLFKNLDNEEPEEKTPDLFHTLSK